MRMVRWLAGGRARIRVRRVSHLALAILMERLTRSTWGSDAQGTGGEWGALSAVSAPSVSPLRECEKSNSKLGERTDIEFHLFFYFYFFYLGFSVWVFLSQLWSKRRIWCPLWRCMNISDLLRWWVLGEEGIFQGISSTGVIFFGLFACCLFVCFNLSRLALWRHFSNKIVRSHGILSEGAIFVFSVCGSFPAWGNMAWFAPVRSESSRKWMTLTCFQMRLIAFVLLFKS